MVLWKSAGLSWPPAKASADGLPLARRTPALAGRLLQALRACDERTIYIIHNGMLHPSSFLRLPA